jgi:hypothetical protein
MVRFISVVNCCPCMVPRSWSFSLVFAGNAPAMEYVVSWVFGTTRWQMTCTPLPGAVVNVTVAPAALFNPLTV